MNLFLSILLIALGLILFFKQAVSENLKLKNEILVLASKEINYKIAFSRIEYKNAMIRAWKEHKAYIIILENFLTQVHEQIKTTEKANKEIEEN